MAEATRRGETLADALRKTLDANHTVWVPRRAQTGGYHALLAKEGLRLRSRKTAKGRKLWVERRVEEIRL